MPGVEWTAPNISQTVVRVPSGGSRLHGTWYAPISSEGNEERLHGVVVAFLPFGEERKGCVRVVHELALKVARMGWGFFSFDYAGTGESPGGFETVTWERVIADADAALRIAMGLYDQCGRRNLDSGSVIFLGIRLGARIAIEAAIGSRHTIDGYCFWEPVFDGEKWLAELRRRSRFRATGGPDQGEGTEAIIDIDGYPFSAELCRNLKSLNNFGTGVDEIPCNIIQVSHRTSPSEGMLEIAEKIGCTEEIKCLWMQPFWLESDLANYGMINSETCDWISSLP